MSSEEASLQKRPLQFGSLLCPDVMPVSCFRIAVAAARWLQSLKISLPNAKIIPATTIWRFTFHEYTRAGPTTPPPNSTTFGFSGCIVLPSPQEGRRYARPQHQETASSGGSNVGLGRGPFQPSAPPPLLPAPALSLFFSSFQIPSFVLSKNDDRGCGISSLFPEAALGRRGAGRKVTVARACTLPHAQHPDRDRTGSGRPATSGRAGPRAAPQPPPPPSRARETPKGSLNTIYKYYGLGARASRPRRPPIGRVAP